MHDELNSLGSVGGYFQNIFLSIMILMIVFVNISMLVLCTIIVFPYMFN